jgi:hypothetical protein
MGAILMKLDPILLDTACRYSKKAYDKSIPSSIKIESKLTSTTVFIIKRKTIDIVCFRGTQSLHDWLFNLSAIPVPYARRLCHGGFVAAHLSVWGKIKKHLHPKKRTLFCGHSLGGALAELSVAKLSGKHPNLNLVAFGKPNTFFKGFKRPMKLDNQISCVYGSDLVATIPRFFYGPSKSQTMLYFANDGADIIDPPKAFRKKDRKVARAMSDHLMGGYTERLEAFLGHQMKPKDEFILTKEEAIEINKLMSGLENANG